MRGGFRKRAELLSSAVRVPPLGLFITHPLCLCECRFGQAKRMSKGMTKAAEILSLYDGARSTREIAKIVGCLPEYVRVVARQRRGAGVSEIDVRYRTSPLGRQMMKRVNDGNKPARRAYFSSIHRTGDHAEAASAAREAYAAARHAGKDAKASKVTAETARRRVLLRTADKAAARAAFGAAKRQSGHTTLSGSSATP